MRIAALGQFDLSRNLLVALAEAGHDVFYGMLGQPRMPAHHERLMITPIPRGSARLGAVLTLLDTASPDVVLVGSAGYDGSNALAAELLASRPPTPIIRVYKEFRVISSERERAVLLGADGLIFNSSETFHYFDSLYGLDDKPILLFDNDVAHERFLPAALPSDRLSDNDGEPHLVIAGTVKIDGSGYDYRDFAVAMADRGVHVHIHAVAFSKWLAPGRALVSNSAEVRDAYEALAARSPLVHLHGGTERQEDQAAEQARYDAGVIQVAPRHYEPEVTPWQHMDHPSKHSFYLAAGLPIAIQRGVLTSMRRHLDPYGVVLRYESEDDLASLLRERELLERLRGNARARRHEFTLQARLPRLLEFISVVQASVAGARVR